MSKYNFINGCKKSLAIHALISMQLINIQHHYVQIDYTEFHQNHTINATSTTRNTFMPLSKERPLLHQFVKNCPSPILNFIQKQDRKTQKVQAHVHLCS